MDSMALIYLQAQEAHDEVRVPRDPHEAKHHGQAPLVGEPPAVRQAALG